MKADFKFEKLTGNKFSKALDLVLEQKRYSQREIEHNQQYLDQHYVAISDGKIVGVVGWYQDNVNYAKEAMGTKFPGEEAYWVGFFAIDKKQRGKGIGFALINKLQKVIKAKGADKLWVSSVPQTRFYYERQGFKILMTGKILGRPKFFMAKDF